MLAHVGARLSQLEPRSTHEIGAYGAGERAASVCRNQAHRSITICNQSAHTGVGPIGNVMCFTQLEAMKLHLLFS